MGGVVVAGAPGALGDPKAPLPQKEPVLQIAHGR